MKAYSRLISRLESCQGEERLQPLVEYFSSADKQDMGHALAILAGYPPRRLISPARLQQEALASSGIPSWLMETCRETTGDLTEALSLMLPEPVEPPGHNLSHCLLAMENARHISGSLQAAWLHTLWGELEGESRFIFNRLLSGTFRMRPGHRILALALQSSHGIDPSLVMRRLVERWDPLRLEPGQLFCPESLQERPGPLDFHPIQRLEVPDVSLGKPSGWIASPWHEGIRVQLIVHEGNPGLWSEGGELLDRQYPDILAAAASMPDNSVFEGLILSLPSAVLDDLAAGRQGAASRSPLRRGREHCLVFDDLLMLGNRDLRAEPLSARFALLSRILKEGILNSYLARLELVYPDSWAAVEALAERSRDRPLGGMLLREAEAGYGISGMKPWYILDPAPMRARLILRFVTLNQRGASGGLEELTLGAESPGGVVTVCKVSPSLSSADLRDLLAVVKGSTVERFGPVRVLQAEQVFEIAFHGIRTSPRHKSGMELVNPVLIRWCRDDTPESATTLAELRSKWISDI